MPHKNIEIKSLFQGGGKALTMNYYLSRKWIVITLNVRNKSEIKGGCISLTLKFLKRFFIIYDIFVSNFKKLFPIYLFV